eukprot:363999-Chlamydomonas_euryale.AAC.14
MRFSYSPPPCPPSATHAHPTMYAPGVAGWPPRAFPDVAWQCLGPHDMARPGVGALLHPCHGGARQPAA